MQTTKIGWTEITWNPATGCTPVSAGCQHCYAKRMAKRLHGRYGYPEDEPFRPTLHLDRLHEPLPWRKPRMIFVCSMGDLFHEEVPSSFIAQVWDMMLACQHHTFQILTKRGKRMRDIMRRWDVPPLPNAWLGVTVEDADNLKRLDYLMRTPAAVRFVSIEPMLGAVDVSPYLRRFVPAPGGRGDLECNALDWVIVGGETGPGARPMHLGWARGIRDQCAAAGVPFFFKQWGEWAPDAVTAATRNDMLRVGRKAAGRVLDGRTHGGMPKTKGAKDEQAG